MSHPPPKSSLGTALAALKRAETALESSSRASTTRVIAKRAELALYVRDAATAAFGSVRAFADVLAPRMDLSASTVRSGLTDQLRTDVLTEAVALLDEKAQADASGAAASGTAVNTGRAHREAA